MRGTMRERTMGTTREKMGEIPPHDEVAEMGVLGAALLDQDAINYVSDIIGPSDFYSEPHRTIFEVILALHKSGADVDGLTVSSELTRLGSFHRVGGAAYLDQLLDTVPMRAHVEEYAKRISRCSTLRSTLYATVGLEASCLGGADDGDVEAAVEKVRTAWEAGAPTDRPMTLSELCKKDYPVHSDWLIRGWWLAEGCGLFAAEEKSSKTTLALAMGMCVAAGRPWLGRWEVRQGPVLALFEEDHERTIRRRAKLLGVSMGLDPHLDNFHVLCQTGITIGGNRSRGRGRLSALIRKYKPVLVILDPIRRLTPGVDENDSRAVSDYLGWLRRQQRECKCAIMCLHHFSKESKEERSAKPGTKRRVTARVRGSSDFLAWYDSLILCERTTEETHKLMALHRGAGRLDNQDVIVGWHDESDSLSLRLSTASSQACTAQPVPGARPEETQQKMEVF